MGENVDVAIYEVGVVGGMELDEHCRSLCRYGHHYALS